MITFSDDKSILLHLEWERISRKKHDRFRNLSEVDFLVKIALENLNISINDITKVYLTKWNNLYRGNINILNGRYLFKCLTFEVIEYVLKRKKKDIKLSNISILVNDFNDINKELIIHIAKNVKTLNIITNHINKCKNIENYLYDEFGIIINVSINKKTTRSCLDWCK